MSQRVDEAGEPARRESDTTDETSVEPFLDRSMRWWDLAFLLIFALVAALTLLDDPTLPGTLIALSALVLVVLGYLAFGRRQLMHEPPSATLPVIGYLLALYGLTLSIATLVPIGSVLFFVAFASAWMMLPVRWATGSSLLFTLAIVLSNVARAGWTPEAWASGLAVGAGVAVAGVLLGLWITGVVAESERRQALIAELERTRTELGEAEHRAGAFAERERLAAEIHDTLAQGLLSIVVHSRAIESEQPELERRIRRIEEIAEENLAEARGLIEALQPAELREHSLPDACGRVCERFGTQTDVDTRFRTEGEPRTLPANTEVVLLRTAQEALTNVRKHARAGRVTVTLSYGEGSVRLSVTDDGVGFAAEEPEHDFPSCSGHRAGLRGMRSRAEQIAGRVELASSPGAGTTISVEVPS